MDDVTFNIKINYHPNPGDDIYIFGNCTDFGNWKELKFKLKWTENDIWTGDYKISKKSKCIEFKFVCHNDSTNENIWEKGKNRLLDPNNLNGLDKTSDGKYILSFIWNYFKINFNLIYRIKDSNQNMYIKKEGKLYQMNYQKGKIIKTKDGKEINEFWEVTINLENYPVDYFGFDYQYNLIDEKKEKNLLNKEPKRHLHIFMKKDDKIKYYNKEHNYFLTNSYLQIIDTIENGLSSSAELKFHQIGTKKIYLGPCLNSDLDLKLLSENGINYIIKITSDKDVEKEEYKEQLDKAKSLGIIIDRYQIEENLNQNDKLEKINDISNNINKLKKDGKVIYICEDELSIEILSYLFLGEDYKINDVIDFYKRKIPNINYYHSKEDNISIQNELNEKINELENLLNKEKTKNNQLIIQINNLENEVKSLNKLVEELEKDKIKLNENLVQLNEELNKNNNELIELKEKLKKSTSIFDKENIILNIISFDENINFSILCKKTDKINKIEEELYDKYPEYRKPDNYFLFKNQRINKFKSLEENNINKGDTLILFY